MSTEIALQYEPTLAQVRLKAKFWSRVGNMPWIKPEELSVAEIEEICARKGLKALWPQPGFQEWFLNQDDTKERLHGLLDLSITAMEQVLQSEDPKSINAKVQCFKVLADLVSKQKAQSGDDMTQEERAALLRQHGVDVDKLLE